MARTSRFVAFGLLASLGPSAALASEIVTFPKGSLIIPMQSSYQSACGTASAYGLVWRILQSNQKGQFNETHPVTVYWAIKEDKKSLNRCVPNNLVLNPDKNAWNKDDVWNDGCDVTKLENATQQPVVPVDYKTDWPATGIYPAGTVPMFTPSASFCNTDQYNAHDLTCFNAYPTYTAVTLNDTSDPRFTNIQYLGGPFIISADGQDAQHVIEFLRKGREDEKDASGALSRFTTSCTCSVFNPDNTANLCNYVAMHQATIQFDAPVSKRINKVPPKIALLGSGDGVAQGILDRYLKSAGLWVVDPDPKTHRGSAGCPEGSTSNCTLNGSKDGDKHPGLIYDQFDALEDLKSTAGYKHGLLNKLDPHAATATPLYRVFWTPHWLPTKDSTDLVDSLNNIAYFAKNPKTGLMAECASLETYESSFSGGPEAAVRQYTTATDFQYTNGIRVNGDKNDNWNLKSDARNCTDPNNDGHACAYYPHPGDLYSQIGDFHFTAWYGHVNEYRANDSASSTRRDGVHVLARSADSDDSWTFFSVGKHVDPATKLVGATVLYLAGHDYSGSIAGTRIVLNTLLNLGDDPQASERAVAPPVAFNDPNGTDLAGTRSLVLQGSFLAVSGYEGDVKNFTASAGARWVFPFLPGDLRAHSLVGGDALKAGANDLDKSVLWDADALMPMPAVRNLFTYFGGVIGPVTATDSVGNFGVTTRHSVLQTKWKVQSIQSDAIQDVAAGCVDHISLVKDGDGHFSFVPGADQVCDLQEALEYTPMPASSDVNAIKVSMKKDFGTVQRMIQRVRGFCWATSPSGGALLEPDDSALCDPGTVSISTPSTTLLPNRAHLGAIVHSTPVVVGDSPYVKNLDNLSRPTVAYFGGYDGQLHAVYVSGGTYSGPKTATFPKDTDAASKSFKKNWAAAFKAGTLPDRGTELWSYLPATQLPLLKTNAARLDSAPLVQDVFVDLTGSGAREWHTVLVMSVGATGRELFAMDVTNPLEPILLWDFVGSIPPSGSQLSANFLATGDLTDTRFPFKWVNGTTHYAGVDGEKSNLFEYSDLGGASGVSLAQLRSGLDPVYAAFVTTNASGATATVSKGIEVFAIDIASGQKLWQWESPYHAPTSKTDPTVFTDNTVPPPATIFNIAPDVPRLYVPDMEGKIWELDANTGINVNFHDKVTYPIPGCIDDPCHLALLNDGSSALEPQPITTNVAIAKVPDTVDTDSLFKDVAGARLLIAGTAGAGWVGSGVPGKLYVLLLDLQYRKPIAAGGTVLKTLWDQEEALKSAKGDGLLQPPSKTGLPLSFTDAHLYGPVIVAGERIFFESAPPAMKLSDPLDLVGLSSTLTGTTNVILEASATSLAPSSPLFSSSKASFGGATVLVASDGIYTIATEVNDIVVTKTDAGVRATTPASSLNPDQSLPYGLLNWLRRKLGQ